MVHLSADLGVAVLRSSVTSWFIKQIKRVNRFWETFRENRKVTSSLFKVLCQPMTTNSCVRTRMVNAPWAIVMLSASDISWRLCFLTNSICLRQVNVKLLVLCRFRVTIIQQLALPWLFRVIRFSASKLCLFYFFFLAQHASNLFCKSNVLVPANELSKEARGHGLVQTNKTWKRSTVFFAQLLQCVPDV